MIGLIASSGGGHLEFILLAIVAFFATAKVLGSLCERVQIPSLVGELLAGIVLGNLYLLVPEAEAWRHHVLDSEFMQIAAELGVIFLLFIVGLETSLADMRRVGKSALLVATIGVVTPFALGYGSGFLLPGLDLSNIEKIFLGAALTATSVGITAKVLSDCRQLQTFEGKTILGAAVFDDVMGLMILAVVSGMATGAALTFGVFALIFAKVGFFFLAAFLVGHYLLPRVIRVPAKWQAAAMMQTVALAVMLLMAWAASMLGLAAIVGAFTAGLLLEETHFQGYAEAKDMTLHKIMTPLMSLFLPLFFVLLGMQVELKVLSKGPIVIATIVLTIVAVVGKIVSGLGISSKMGDRLSVGFGMIPRGEVGLVFAAVGLSSGAITSEFYGVIVLVVVLTTVVAPVLLRRRLTRIAGSQTLDRSYIQPSA